jgi:triosephosphate isomerase
MRKPFVAGNWKMNTDSHTSVSLAEAVASGASDIAEQVHIAVIPPFVYIPAVVKAVSNAHIAVGAQDIYYEQKGAFTGEISPSMLKDIGCTYALCGHSERRHVIGETDELVNKKVNAAISGGLLPILCVGELIEQRKASETEEVVTRQIKNGLADGNTAAGTRGSGPDTKADGRDIQQPTGRGDSHTLRRLSKARKRSGPDDPTGRRWSFGRWSKLEGR